MIIITVPKKLLASCSIFREHFLILQCKEPTCPVPIVLSLFSMLLNIAFKYLVAIITPHHNVVNCGFAFFLGNSRHKISSKIVKLVVGAESDTQSY